MPTNTVQVGGGNWSSAGTWSAGVPAAGDDVVLGAASGQLTIDVNTNTIRSLICTGYTNTLTHNAGVTLNIGGASAPVGNIALIFVGTETYTLGNATTSAIAITDTSAATNTYNFAGKTLGNVTINNGTTTTTQLATNGFLQASTAAVTLTQGKLDTNGQTCTWGFFVGSGASTRTVTLGASSITLSGRSGTTFYSWDMSGTNQTVSAGTSTITMTFAGAALNAGASQTYNNVIFNGGSLGQVVGSAATFANLTFTGTAITTCQFGFQTNATVTGTLTVTGNSAINRVLLFNSTSNSLGTSKTITAAVVSLTNVDIQDIAAAGAAIPFTGTSLGDCGGNTNITFTTPAAQTWSGNTTGNWSTAANWTSRIPLPQDDVAISGLTSGTVTADMPRLGRSIDFTGSSGGTFAQTATAAPNGGLQIYGSFTFAAALTWSTNTNAYVFAGRSSYTINNAGKTGNSFMVAAPTGTYTLAHDFLFAVGAGSITVNYGTFALGGFNLRCGNLVMPATATGTNLGSGTLTLSGTGTVWNIQAANTVTASTSTIAITDTSSTSKTFQGQGKTYNNLTITGGSGTAVIISGANTFQQLTVTNPDTVLTFPSTTTNTVSGFSATGQNNGYLFLPGIGANYASTPNAVQNQITSNFTVDINCALVNWASGASAQVLMGKIPGAANFSWQLFVNATGSLALNVFSDGTSSVTFTSSVATGFTANSQNWVRASFTLNGASSNVNFYTSPDGSTWTILGTNRVVSIATMFNSTGIMEIGSNTTGTSSLSTGKFYEAKLYNSALGSSSGTPVFDANFATKAFGANSFTESSSNAATVTINGAQAQAGDGRILINSSTPASAATLSSSSRVALDYVTVQDNTAAGVTPFYAGAHGVLISGDTNWLATAPPKGTPNLMLMGI